MDLVRANIMVDTLLNTAHDLRNLAAEETDPQVRAWLESKSSTLGRDALEVVTLPLEGFQMPLASPALDASGE